MDPYFLSEVPLFAGLPDDDLEEIAERMREQEVPEGHHLVDRGKLAFEFFVIAEGRAAVFVDEEKLAELGRGDFFGEIGLVMTERRMASVVALTPMRLYVMFARQFAQLIKEFPDVGQRVEAAARERFPGPKRNSSW
jgi:CRP-like cAMP-binding protein